MLRPLTLAFCLVSASGLPSGAAQSDADYLTEQFLAADGMRLLEEGAAMGKAEAFALWLRARSVKVAEPKGLAAEMGRVSDPVFQEQMHALFKKRCLSKFSDAELSAAAEHVRREGTKRVVEEGPGEGAVIRGGAHLEEDVAAWAARIEQAGEAIRRDDFKVGLGSMMCLFQLRASLANHMRINAKVEESRDPERLAALLEMPGLFEFPNRIVRRKVMDELRELSR